MSSSALSQRISVRLLEDIVSGTLTGGAHLRTQQIAERYGVSRTPVRDALTELEQQGVIQRQANRGYFVADSIPEQVTRWLEEQRSAQPDDYQRLSDDWLTDRLPEEVTEQFLRQHYDLTRAKVTDLLMRAVREGWAERKEGYGWRFLPVAKTPAAFDEIYRFRMAIEPAAMLEPSFELDRKVLDELKRVQSRMIENGLETMAPERLLDNGADFHEQIIKMSNNPFFISALQRANRMRRLMEYRAEINRERLMEQCGEHLEMVRLLEKGDVVEASYFMRRHLGGALRRKSPIARNWSEAANAAPPHAT
ncbi:GntR family transcriptional regulator [Acuticoccus kandeliae]|uniref:GntR family transcriptional regulator n=1 Tax=Acuticoccus kandeliae TaxID=2073160 RepID=UPI000D3E264C|nr:GntR family transcriptional regulator [Acuticoccus kandeliae]